LEFEDHVGRPLTEGLMMVHNALVGVGLRRQVKIGASGKVASGSDIVKRLIQGADYTNAARAMMMATGCIQSQRCHTNQCPVGVATQDPKRAHALDVGDKSLRVQRFQAATVAEAGQIMASMGAHSPRELRPDQLIRRVRHHDSDSYAELYDWLRPEELLGDAPPDWAGDWKRADPDQFGR
jgi:glutamate synthase domain-containing protein 2